MPVSVASSGSQTCTLDTDHILVTQTAPTDGAVYQLRVDTSNIAIGESLTMTLLTEARDADGISILYESTIQHSQHDPIKDSPMVAAAVGVDVRATIRQEGGTGRAVPWALLRLDG